MSSAERQIGRGRVTPLAIALAGASLVGGPPGARAADPIATEPLILGSSQAPASLYLVPSVEWPTINSPAHIDSSYSANERFIGYFDPEKCYEYVFSTDEEERRFEPTDDATNRKCNGTTGEWSGNFLNWTTTQTIDPFRKAMTGGLRVKDTTEVTWLEKARYDGSGGSGIFPDRNVSNSGTIQAATPFDSANSIALRVRKLGVRMRFRTNGGLGGQAATVAYDPTVHGDPLDPTTAYEVHVRVEVCDEDGSFDLEDNCEEYNGNYKPEGLIQANDTNLRYSVFGYLNHSVEGVRDGAVLRAKKKYVGPTKIDPATGEETSNPQAEWDSDGILIQDPNTSESSATESDFGGISEIDNSGVINYLNKFGQLTDNDHKSQDPVSEMYYAMTRYLRNEGPVDAYHEMSSATPSEQQQYADEFPVITNWDDPVDQFECSPNIALGIGDIFTHNDKNLPGNTSSLQEPTKPPEVQNDGEVNVVELTNKVGELEGLGNIGNGSSWSGRDNSAYIAGLAYDTHTRDQRPNADGEQRLSTYWVDVVERQDLQGFSSNQYALATKYGGFEVPQDFDPETRTDPLPQGWWSDGDIASIPNDGTTFTRPRNYFVANDAAAMTVALRKAFSKINEEAEGSSAAVATNTTRLTTSTLIYQGRFNSADWSGDVLALEVDPNDGTVDESNPAWRASENVPTASNRNIFTISGGSGITFEWGNLSNTQQDELNDNPATDVVDNDNQGQARLDYLRGDTSSEVRNGGSFRDRFNSLIGDVVNSDPYLARGQNFGYTSLPGDAGSTYSAYLTSKSSRQNMLYVGANDGMLHAFDGRDSGGDEEFAYIPDAAIDELNRLTSPDYTHRYYVDEAVRVADVYADLASDGNNDTDGNGSNEDWHSVLVGSMGAGGKAVFALDVSNPTSFEAADVLWEFTDPDLGFSFGQPNIVRLNNGNWAALFGDGYDNTTTDNNGDTVVDGAGSATAGLFIVPLENPGNSMFIDTGAGTDSNPNGIAEVTPVDLNGDKITDVVYGGDLRGNIWKFDLRGNDNQWSADKKFQATGPDGDPQPITVAPAIGPHDDSDVTLMLYFGTGEFFRDSHTTVPADPQIQSFYAIADRDDNQEVNDNKLIQQEILDQTANSFRVLSDKTVDFATRDGWYINLKNPNVSDGEGERVFNPPTVRNERVIFQTNIPERGICNIGGASWIMEMNATDGSRIDDGVFDTDGDGDVDDDDRVKDVDNDGQKEHAGGQGLDGLTAGMAILDTDRAIEFKEISKSSGSVETITESSSSQDRGRQSWRQYR